MLRNDNDWCKSECASEDIDDADKRGSIPFDSDCSIDFVVPETRAWNVESTVGLLHNDAICNEFEVLIDWCDVLENLNIM